MSHVRPARRRLAAAVATVVAVTVGATALTAPANAAPAAGAREADADATDVARFPADAGLRGVGESGYLISVHGTPIATDHWLPKDGSAMTEVKGAYSVDYTGSGDLVAANWPGVMDITDMGTGQKLFSARRGSSESYVGAAGTALFTSVHGDSGDFLTMHAMGVERKRVVGLPTDAREIEVQPGTAEHALVTYNARSDTGVWQSMVATLDLATGTVAEAYPRHVWGDYTLSPTHLAWVEYGADDLTTVVTVDRATKEIRRTVVGHDFRHNVDLGLIGDWVTYGTRSGLYDLEKNPLDTMTARNLKDGVTTRKVLDHTFGTLVASDGALVAMGGTVEQGVGLYRIVQGADGLPTATRVASTGRPTKVTLMSSKVPSVVDLDRNGGRAKFEWTLSRWNVTVTVTLRHQRTGRSFSTVVRQPFNGVVSLDWDGLLDSAGVYESAYNGDYAWELNAEPMNGIGPNLVTSGTFKVVHLAAPHDFNDNGSPDVLMRDSKGGLWRSDTLYKPSSREFDTAQQKLLGTGWNGYNQIEAAGNIGGAAHGDLIARDTAGVLWHFLGKGDGTFTGRYKIASGMGGYNKFAAGSDLNGDGKADLVATDTAGVMWLYKGTGSWSAPYKPRVKIGTGWNGYNQITATGNIAGGAAGDLVARDASGVLWLYLGKGDGTFAPRVRIGAGWGGYGNLVGIGDINHDGRPDLYAANSADHDTYVYKGTGSWSAPFSPRQAIYVPNNWPTAVA
ncbi:FG-GAP repeat domain-containing protein [Streptomyces sp. NPDC014779]|uniref:FG-GAP repeat domain-containing protein n=1 Tax=Streptomyces sp. NPDC014779 TaxID=3364911 RepID=UPI0036FEEE73